MKFLGFGKTEEERDVETIDNAEEIARKAEEAKLDQALDRVIFFPGSIDEYESVVGYRVKVIDTGKRHKAMRFFENENHDYIFLGNLNLKRHLVEQKVEAVVNCGYTRDWTQWNVYGLPVAKSELGAEESLVRV